MVGRAVRRPPKSAARGLALWAVDLWPYVNGKATTLGLNLGEMEMTQMLDIIHYFFEDDSRYSSAEEAEAVSEFRAVIYGMLYGTTYKYKTSSKSGNSMRQYGVDEVKPYIPPTDFDPDMSTPFGSVLDAPFS